MKLYYEDFIPKKSASGFTMNFKRDDESLSIWYRANYRHWDYKEVRCKVPIYIETNDLFWEVLGILQGEMKKSVKNLGYANIAFSNSNPDIVNHVLRFFELFFEIILRI